MTSPKPQVLFTAEGNIESFKVVDGRIVSVRDMLNKRYVVDIPADGVWAGGRKLLRWGDAGAGR